MYDFKLILRVFLQTFSAAFLLSCASFLQAQTEIPDYESTFNTGKGKQQRLNTIEEQLQLLSDAAQKDQVRLYEELPSKKDLEEMKKMVQLNSKDVKKLKEDLENLRRENQELKAKLAQVQNTELQETIEFVRPLKEGEYEKLQQEIEALKLTARSLEGVIESMNQSP